MSAVMGGIPVPVGKHIRLELVDRFWTANVMGGYCTHGETYLDGDDVFWWSRGGVLRGQSAELIAFLKGILQEMPGSVDYLEDPDDETGDLRN